MVLSPLKFAHKKAFRKDTEWTGPLFKVIGGGGALKDKTQHACVRMLRGGQPAYAATFKGEKKRKCWGMPLWPINVQSLFFLYVRFVFDLIRTQAFSVFSEVSSGGTAVRQNKTQKSVRKRRHVDDLVFILIFFLIVSFLLFFFFIPLWHHLLSLGRIWFEAAHPCVREQLSFCYYF